MKKLLSICFLSIVLVLAGFTSKAQTTNCCFWLENMQPDTLQDISNLEIEPGTAALLPGQGNELVLKNTLNYVGDPALYTGGSNPIQYVPGSQTDWYRVRFQNTCDLSADTKVALEWKLYRDGVLLTDANISDYADIYIFTRYDELSNTSNVNATCGHVGWLGGRVYGPGVCRKIHNDCQGGYPGSMEVDPTDFPYSANGFSSAGYVRLAHGYNLDYFYLGFFQSTETRIAIKWKYIGNYSLVVGLRERTNGTAFNIWADGNQNSFIGGHQSCCGDLLASDSLHYLVTSASQKAVCDGSTYEYGKPLAVYSEEGQYNVLFGEYVCDHWKVDHIDALSFYTRINPNIVASNKTICVNDPFTAQDLAALAPAVDTVAPGLIDHKIYWKKSTGTQYSTVVPTPDYNTVGTTTYYVYQENHYDSVTGDTIYCVGNVDTITFKVLPVIAPLLDDTQSAYEYCNEAIDANSTLVIKAKLNNDAENNCADHIHWFQGTSHTGDYYDGAANTLNLIDLYDNNNDKKVVFTAFSYDASTETYSNTGVSVTINFWKTPELQAQDTQDSIVVCPNTTGISLSSNFKSVNFNNTEIDWTYVWTKNGEVTDDESKNISVVAPGCDEIDVYTVTATATSKMHGCEASITRSFKVYGQDHVAPVLAWKNPAQTNVNIDGCDFSVVDPAMDLAELKEHATITDNCSADVTVYNVTTDTVSYTNCEKVLRRTFTVTDDCGNLSNAISHTFTVKNNNVPAIKGNVVTLDPVRPLNNNCECNLYTYAQLLNYFNQNFEVTATCEGTNNDDPLFYLNVEKTVDADSNTNIFASTNEVVVYAQVKDECGHVSSIVPVFRLLEPAHLNVAHGAITASKYDFCNTDTGHVVFDPNMIQNGKAPYAYTWSQTPIPAQCGIAVADNSIEADVWALRGDEFNSVAQFILTIKDAYGCVTTDTSNAFRWFGIPDVQIVENTHNSGYPHAVNPTDIPSVCPTYGNYHVVAAANANLPAYAPQTLTYSWSGESISYTSTTENAFIAVNEQECDRYYTITVNVENAKGCKASDIYIIKSEDIVAPVLTVNKPTDTITDLVDCKIVLGNYASLYNTATISDNCWGINDITVSQSPSAGTILTENTDVIITVTPKCGPAAYDTIRVCFPANRIETKIVASEDSACFPYSTTFTTITRNFSAPLSIYWDGSSVSADSKSYTTAAETGNTLTHKVRVVDANGCETTDEYTLLVYHTPVASDVAISTTPNHYCDDQHFDGTFTVSSVTGSEVDAVKLHGDNEWHALPYSETVPQGTYNFDLRTIHGCVAENITTANVLKDTTDLNLIPNLSLVTDNANCSKPWTGSVQVMNPVVGYTYYITPGAEESGDQTIVYNPSQISAVSFVYLYQDDYKVFVTSTFNCHANASVTIDDDRLIPDTIKNFDVTANTNCTDPKNGVITLHNTDPNFYYSLDGQSEFPGGNNISFTQLDAGYHTLIIASYLNPEHTKFNCHTSQNIFVKNNSNAPFAGTPVVTPDEYCINGNGSIEFDPIDGVQYILGEETLVAPNVLFDNLEGDSIYTITLFDVATGCNSTAYVSVDETPLYPTFGVNEIQTSANINCTGTPNGKISINEVANYEYTVYDAEGTIVSDLTTLAEGTYTVVKHSTITGCDKSTSVEINNNYPEFSIKLSASKDLDCSEIGTGVVTVVNRSFGVDYSIYNSQEQVTTFENLNPGLYTVKAVVTSTGCSYEDTVSVKSDFTYPVLSAVTTANYSCRTLKNGTITITDEQENPNYSSITVYVNGIESDINIHMNSGDYTITAISNYNCPAEPIVATVKDSAFIIRDFEIVPNSACNPTFNRPGNGKIIVLNPQSSECDYVFTFLGEYDVNHFDPINYTKYTLLDGKYVVRISDNRTGCNSVDTVVVPFVPDTVKIDQITSTPDYYCSETIGNGSIYVHAYSVNESSDLYYSIDGVHFQASNTFANLQDGIYNVVVIDSSTLCKYEGLDNSNITVGSDKYAVDFTFNTKANTACEATLYNGAVNVTAKYHDSSIGVGSFTYSIEGGSFQNIKSGNYTVTAIDSVTGCSYDSVATVLDSAQFRPHISVIAYNYSDSIAADNYHYCKNQDNGYMIASAYSDLEGDNLFHYQWNNSCHNINPIDEWTNVSTTDDYLVCDYTVTVTSDLTGCSNFATVKVTIDTLPVIEFYADGPSIRRVSGTSTDNILYANCQNKEFTLGVRDNGLKYISWSNTHESSDASFVIPANYLEVGNSSFCVVITDNNNCTSGPTSVTVKTLPISTATDTIIACDTYTYHNNGVVADTSFTFAASGANVHTIIDTLDAINTCDSIVTYTIILNSTPNFDVNIATELNAAYCDGSYIISGTDTSLSVLYTQDYGWRIIGANDVPAKLTYNTAGEEFDPTSALSDTMNGKAVYAYAANSCDTILTEKFVLKVYNAPTLATRTLANDTICLGQAANFVAPTGINWHGSEGTSQLQYSRNGGRTWSQYIAPVYPALADTFAVRFVASNMCDSDVVLDGPVYVTVNDTVKLSATHLEQTICLGEPIDTIKIDVANATISTTTLPTGLSYTPTMIVGAPTAAGVYFDTITATSACGCAAKTLYTRITVNDTVKLQVENANQTICLGDTIKHIVIKYANANVASLVSVLPDGLTVSSDTIDGDYSYTIKGAPKAAGATTIPVNAISFFECSNSNDTIRLIVKDTVTLTLNTPTVQTDLSQNICLGSSVNPINYVYTNATVSVINFGTLDSVANGISGTPTNLDTIRYSIIATSNNGCTASNKHIDGVVYVKDTVTINVDPNVLSQEICLGQAIDTINIINKNSTLRFVNLGTLSHSDNMIFGTPTSTDTIRYTIFAESDNGCDLTNKSVEGIVIVNDTTKLSATPLAQTLCLGNPINDITIVSSNGTVAVNGLVSGVTFDGNNTIAGTPDTAGVFPYTITITSTYGCTPDKTINDTIVVNDTVSLAAVTPAYLSQTVCKGTEIEDIYFNFANASLSIEGSLPAGISFVDSVISGTPTTKDLEGTTFKVIASSTSTPACTSTNKSIEVTIKVNDVPELTPITGGDLEVCLGDTFVTPVAPTVTENGYTTTTMWEYDGSEYSWSTPSTADMNGAEFYYVATNTCGTTRDTATFTVDTLPVPAIVSDTIVCEDGVANLAVLGTFVTYQWYMDNAKIDDATASSYSYVANDGEGTYQFSVVVKDANGCISTTNSNATLDVRPFSNDTTVTVIVTGKPRFIFTHNGAETHTFNATTSAPSTQYQWMISNPCNYNEDELVFVNFDIYYNGELIDDDSIGLYISEAGINTNRYVSQDMMEWVTSAGAPMSTTCYYNYAQSNMTTGYYQSNHFPVGNLSYPGGGTKFDDLYLHFLNNRSITKTFNQFRRPGQYTIVYELFATANSHPNGHYYKTDENESKVIGGYDALVSPTYTLLAHDELTINITGVENDAPFAPAPDMSPEVENAPVAKSASMKVFPNPATKASDIRASFEGVSGNATVKIQSLAGSVISQQETYITAGTPVQLNGAHKLVPGVYIITVQTSEATISRKLVVSE